MLGMIRAKHPASAHRFALPSPPPAPSSPCSPAPSFPAQKLGVTRSRSITRAMDTTASPEAHRAPPQRQNSAVRRPRLTWRTRRDRGSPCCCWQNTHQRVLRLGCAGAAEKRPLCLRRTSPCRPPLVTLLLLASGPARERQHLSRASGGRDAIIQRYCAGTSP